MELLPVPRWVDQVLNVKERQASTRRKPTFFTRKPGTMDGNKTNTYPRNALLIEHLAHIVCLFYRFDMSFERTLAYYKYKNNNY